MPALIVINGLYSIVDDSFLDPVETAEKILAGGCKLLQLRAKMMAVSEFLRTAIAIRKATEKVGAVFIVNDRIDVAILSGADGIHLGQEDLPIEAARMIIGEDKVIGVSTHGIEEALSAESRGADYIGFGPIFSTNTKKDARSVQGVGALAEIASKISVPVVAIGGINEKNIRNVYDNGADATAVISAIAGADNITAMTSKLVNMKGGSW